MSLRQNAQLAASIVRDKASDSLRRRGGLGSAIYLTRNCLRLARSLRFRIREVAYDREMSVETDRLIAAGDLGLEQQKIVGLAVNANGIAYQATPAWMLTNILKNLSISYPDYSFVDFGSGMGRAVLMAAEFPFRSVVGIEFSRELHCVAETNLRRSPAKRRRAASLELLCMDAAGYQLPDGNCIVYMFNPFREAVMKGVLATLERRQRSSASELYVIYLNPVLAHLLDAAPFLRRTTTSKFYSVYRSFAS